MDDLRKERLRALPAIDELLSSAGVVALLAVHPRPLVVDAVRAAVASARMRVLDGDSAGFSDADIGSALARLSRPNLRRVFNATGVVLHTNLGRAPLAGRAIARVAEVAQGYCNLELDLDEGERGSRYAPVVELLRTLTGCEDAMVVNNCAAAVLLTFSAIAQGREAIVSRGELVEIGGGFRVPDVMRQSGAKLVEVGTTNRTRVADYATAVSRETGLIVKVHRSNFDIIGFTESASTAELAALAHEHGVTLFEDLGSGALRPLHAAGLFGEPTVSSAIADGAHLVAFSGDKLLGGPQAGILVGRREAIARLKEHPLNRALRVDKLTIAALEATLELYRDGLEDEAIPVRMMLLEDVASLEARASRLSTALAAHGLKSEVVRAEGLVGGGSLPLATLTSRAVVVDGGAELHERLRLGDPAVVARLVDGRNWLDVRCLRDEDLPGVARAVKQAQSNVELPQE